jgi:hypothetical protein
MTKILSHTRKSFTVLNTPSGSSEEFRSGSDVGKEKGGIIFL